MDFDMDFSHCELQPCRQHNYQLAYALKRQCTPSFEMADALKTKLQALVVKHGVAPTIAHGRGYGTFVRHQLPPWRSIPIALYNTALDHVKFYINPDRCMEIFNEKKLVTTENASIGEYEGHRELELECGYMRSFWNANASHRKEMVIVIITVATAVTKERDARCNHRDGGNYFSTERVCPEGEFEEDRHQVMQCDDGYLQDMRWVQENRQVCHNVQDCRNNPPVKHQGTRQQLRGQCHRQHNDTCNTTEEPQRAQCDQPMQKETRNVESGKCNKKKVMPPAISWNIRGSGFCGFFQIFHEFLIQYVNTSLEVVAIQRFTCARQAQRAWLQDLHSSVQQHLPGWNYFLHPVSTFQHDCALF